uniref:D7 short form salivary protein n=1 Tax=Anopheles minimus TaxID=112268 RepID=A0A1Y9IVC9_9DIPT
MKWLRKHAPVLLSLSVLLIAATRASVTDCVQLVPDSASNIVCEVRQYRVTRGIDADQYIQCALAALGFVDENGTVQRNTLLTALDAVEVHDGVYTDSVDACLSKSKKLSGAERSGAFYCCMLRTESAQNFKDAVELQELKTASKWPEGERFDRSKVQQMMREVNNQLKC